MAISPAYTADGTLFVGTFNGQVNKSTDRAGSWTDRSEGLAGARVSALAVSPAYPGDQTVFAGTMGQGIFWTANGGLSWAAANDGLTNHMVTSLAISPGFATDHTVFAGTFGGVFRSTNGGDSWALANNGRPYPEVYALALSPDYRIDGTLYSSYTRVWVSRDRGQSWSELDGRGWSRYAGCLAVSPWQPRAVFMGTDGQSVWRYLYAGAAAHRTYLPCVIRGG